MHNQYECSSLGNHKRSKNWEAWGILWGLLNYIVIKWGTKEQYNIDNLVLSSWMLEFYIDNYCEDGIGFLSLKKERLRWNFNWTIWTPMNMSKQMRKVHKTSALYKGTYVTEQNWEEEKWFPREERTYWLHLPNSQP